MTHTKFAFGGFFPNQVPSARQTLGRGRIAIDPKRIQQSHLSGAGGSANSTHVTNLPISGVLAKINETEPRPVLFARFRSHDPTGSQEKFSTGGALLPVLFRSASPGYVLF